MKNQFLYFLFLQCLSLCVLFFLFFFFFGYTNQKNIPLIYHPFILFFKLMLLPMYCFILHTEISADILEYLTNRINIKCNFP